MRYLLVLMAVCVSCEAGDAREYDAVPLIRPSEIVFGCDVAEQVSSQSLRITNVGVGGTLELQECSVVGTSLAISVECSVGTRLELGQSMEVVVHHQPGGTLEGVGQVTIRLVVSENDFEFLIHVKVVVCPAAT